MQKLKLVYKDIIGVLSNMLKNPKFKNNLHYEGKIERVDPADCTSERIFGDMHTGLWIQRAQSLVGCEKTPIGIVFYSDKTHALQGMQCYPLYSTSYSCECMLFN